MPRVQQKQDGHYVIRTWRREFAKLDEGHEPEGQYGTWQVDYLGEAYLLYHGLLRDGAQLSVEQFLEMDSYRIISAKSAKYRRPERPIPDWLKRAPRAKRATVPGFGRLSVTSESKTEPELTWKQRSQLPPQQPPSPQVKVIPWSKRPWIECDPLFDLDVNWQVKHRGNAWKLQLYLDRSDHNIRAIAMIDSLKAAGLQLKLVMHQKVQGWSGTLRTAIADISHMRAPLAADTCISVTYSPDATSRILRRIAVVKALDERYAWFDRSTGIHVERVEPGRQYLRLLRAETRQRLESAPGWPGCRPARIGRQGEWELWNLYVPG